MKNLGDLKIQKGNFGEIPLVMWDALPNCNEDCTIWESCPYEKDRAKCEMRRGYISSVLNSLQNAIKVKDEINVLKLGLLLMPLFTHLVDFKIVAHSLNGNTTFVSRGAIKMHPVYKEMRGTIKMINELLNDLGLGSQEERKGLLNGDSDYYDDMVQKGEVPR